MPMNRNCSPWNPGRFSQSWIPGLAAPKSRDFEDWKIDYCILKNS